MILTPYPDAPRPIIWCGRVALTTAFLGLVATVAIVGYEALPNAGLARTLLVLSVAPGLLLRALVARRTLGATSRVRPLFWDIAAALLGTGAALSNLPDFLGFVAAGYHVLTIGRLVASTESGRRLGSQLPAQPTKLLLVSFLATIAIGSMFLTFPRATTDGAGVAPLDAAFMATSATCVTGLSVINTSDRGERAPGLRSLTGFGQVILLVLIQIGGLGIMTLSAAVVLLLGGKLGPRSHAALRTSHEADHRHHLERSLRFILKMTLAFEATGAVLLLIRFWPHFGDFGEAAWNAVFLSISAFNNAGFSLMPDSLMSFRSDLLVNGTLMTLVVFGGLGFTVIATLTQWRLYRQPIETLWIRWPPQVKVVVSSTLWLIFGGALCFYFFDFDHSLKGLSRGDKLLASLFHSVTYRTAGFYTVDLSAMSRVTLLVSLLLMYIGGSPGGTAGGAKTTTVAVAYYSVRAMLTGRDEVEVHDRTIAKPIVYRATAILLTFTGIWLLGVALMFVCEPDKSLESLLFETMSALCTVGVSYGITPWLSTAGKIVLILLMFVGRVGPLSMALAVGEGERGPASVRLPEGKIMVG